MKNISEHILTEPLKDFIQRLLAFMPNLLTCLIIFVFGFIAAWIVKYVVSKIANLLRVDGFCAKVGITETFGKVGIKEPPARLLSRIFYWLVVIIFVIIALYTLRVPAIEKLLEKFFLYLPDLFVAALLIIIGYILGNFLGRATLIASVNAGVRFSRLLSKGVKTIVVLLASVMALEQLGIGRGTAIVAFTILFGGFVFALSLSFGLGGKDIARQYLEGKVKGEAEEKDDLTHI
ncbi:MAG: mechanosensitive ion channel family protein [Thermodesulfobacteriota bacterium]